MSKGNDEDGSPIGAGGLAEDHDDDLDDETDDESRPLMWAYYERRKDAFRAIRAADLLGISCHLRNQWSPRPNDTMIQEWVVELRLTDCPPTAAHSSIVFSDE